jgi:hypothetical protein
VSGPGRAQILAIVRASPVRARTAALVESILGKRPPGLVRVVVLSRRQPGTGPELGDEEVEEVPAEADFLGQVERLARASRCRWLVLPSSVDRYLPGALEAIAESGAAPGRTVVGPCQVIRDSRPVVIGPHPFRLDYFALLSGFNYIAPGATFIDIERYLSGGGLDPRYPSAGIYEYVLRIGVGHGLDCCPSVLLETEAVPFPGIAPERVASYGGEALSMLLTYNRSFLTPGSALGLGAVLADQLAPFRHKGFYDKRLVSLVAAGAGSFRQRYLDQLGTREPSAPVRPVVASVPSGAAAGPDAMGSGPVSAAHRIRLQVKALTPRPVWDLLRRARRGWESFRDPLV